MVEALDQAHHHGHRCVVMQLPTGGGKGNIIAFLAAREAAQGPRLPGSIVIVAHLGEILSDVWKRALAAGCPDDGTVVVTSIQAIEAGDVTFPNARLFLGDEWHRAACASVQGLMARHPGVRFVAFTATPARADGKPLAGFTHIVQGPQVRELVALGLLAPITVLAPTAPSSTLAQDPVAIYPEGRPGIVFAASVAHSVSIANGLSMARRIVAEHVDGSPEHARRRASAIERFNAGHLQVLTCLRLLAEGVDLPAAEVCVLASPVTSTVTFLQTIGRVRRPQPGKRALLLDLCGSVHLHGLPDEDRTYHLEGGAIRLAEADRTQAATCCRQCLAWGPPRSVCEMCGATRPAAPPPRVMAKDMVEQRAAEPQEQKRKVLARFVADAVRKGHNPWSAAHRFRGRYGHAPPREWMAAAIAGRAA